MNELVPVMEAQTLEDVLASGDLSKLTPEQRVAYYFRVCETLRLNPYTRPFDYITLNGKRVLYAKRDATDQLRQIRNITLTVTDKRIEDDLYIVTVRATDGRSRSDEDFGAVSIAGLKGEARANAILKAITKAKRRVTLSICGMGMSDESEVVTIPGAVTEDLELPPPSQRDQINTAVPLKAVAANTPKAPVKRAPVDAEDAYQAPPKPGRTDDQWRVWLDKLAAACSTLYSRSDVADLGGKATVGDALATGPQWVQAEISKILAENYARFPEEPDPELEIVGEKYAAG